MAIRPAGWEDLESVAELLRAQNRAVSGIAGVKADDLRRDWSLPGFVVGADSFVAVERDRISGYAAVSPGRELLLAGTGSTLADELFVRITERARARGDEAIAVSVTTPGSPHAALVRRHPFDLDRETWRMGRALVGSFAKPKLPAGVSLRTFEPDDAYAVHRLLDGAYLGWDARYVPVTHEDWIAFMTGDSEFDASTWWLAHRGDTIVGCALYWSTGWLKDLAVIASERGRGLGAALIQAGFAEFSRRGRKRIGLKVDPMNPTGAVRLYERLGFVIEGRESIWRLPL